MSALDEAISKLSGISSEDDENSKTVNAGDYILNLQNTYNDIAKIRTMIDKTDKTITDALILELRKLYDKASIDALPEFMELCKAAHEGLIGKTAASSDIKTDDHYSLNKGQDIDWAKKYDSMSNKDAFWEYYYTVAWGAQKGARIKALGEAFKQECRVYGFTEDTNPFIVYLGWALDSFNVTKDVYFAIHDAIARGSSAITENDLIHKGGDALNLLRNREFYTLSNDSARTYINYVAEVKRLSPTGLTTLRRNLGAKKPLADGSDEAKKYNILTYLSKDTASDIDAMTMN